MRNTDGYQSIYRRRKKERKRKRERKRKSVVSEQLSPEPVPVRGSGARRWRRWRRWLRLTVA